MGVFAEFLQRHGIETVRLQRRSDRVEATRPEDRALALRRAELREPGKTPDYVEAGLDKPRSGRGVGQGHVVAALEDRPLPRLVRAKLTRAVNSLLAERDQPPVDATALFGDIARRKGRQAPAR
jgi:hypothetical protein